MPKPIIVGLFVLCAACNGPDASEDGAVRFDAAPRHDAQPGEDAAIDAARPSDAAASDAAGSSDASARDASSPSRDASRPVDASTPIRDAGRDAGSRGTAGCGGSARGDGAFATRSIRAGGADRTYRILVPATYDSERAYPVVFKWHGFGGDGLSGGIGVEFFSGEDAIIVSGDAVGGAWDLTPGGRDVAYFDALLDQVGRDYCVDRDRVFSFGFSRGGGMSNLLACERADVVRGSGAVAGIAAWSASCTRPVATWFLHDTDDDAVAIGDSIAMRDRFLAANGCSSATTPTEPSPCVRYEGCAAGYPVVWCQTTGVGHNPRADIAPAAVWSFFRALP